MIWIRRHLFRAKKLALWGPSINETPMLGMDGKRSGGDVPDTVFAVDMSVVQAHAQWWDLALKPQVEASWYSVLESVDGAISA